MESENFTCFSCNVAFKTSELQRDHYKTDWHRYNLKRKVAEFPPVTVEDFNRKVLQKREVDGQDNLTLAKYCQFCRRSFASEKSYENHLQSKKHRANEKLQLSGDEEQPNIQGTSTQNTVQHRDADKGSESSSSIEEIGDDEWNSVADCRDCLFCLHHSRSMLVNLRHMTQEHSFFIPDVDYCIDIRGLLEYLSEKINQGFMCLWCNEAGRTFHSGDAARAHMCDKGHCKMVHEGPALAEYVDFYDYSTSYPDAEEVSNDNEEVTIPELSDDDYQLVLPSGATIGHRSLFRYFKQSIDPNRATTLVISKNSRKVHRVVAQYRALGWTPESEVAAARRARDIHYMKRQQTKYYEKLGTKANKLQTHFRQQVNF